MNSKDPRSMPAYPLPEAAHYLLVPKATLRSWVKGRPYPTARGVRFFRPVITLPSRQALTLSFVNLVEAHVLEAIRKRHEIRLDKVRTAIQYLQDQFGSEHPLADYRFETDGIDLFVQRDVLINVSKAGQLAVRQLLQAHLERVEYDKRGLAIRLYPFTRKQEKESPRSVVIDPFVSFGRPVIAGTGIPTSVVAERYKAGDSIEDLSADYGRNHLEIEEAIRCELQLEAA